jgi:hypothetical protein
MSTSKSQGLAFHRQALEDAIRLSLRGAFFSEDRIHRYVLWRRWSDVGPMHLFIGLNPSTADEFSDDPTVRRCVNFAKRFNAGGLMVANLFSFRATKPADLFKTEVPIDSHSDHWLLAAADLAGKTIACWGSMGGFRERSRQVRPLLCEPMCFGTTVSGEPCHPLYLRRTTELVRFD